MHEPAKNEARLLKDVENRFVCVEASSEYSFILRNRPRAGKGRMWGLFSIIRQRKSSKSHKVEPSKGISITLLIISIFHATLARKVRTKTSDQPNPEKRFAKSCRAAAINY